MVLRSARNRYGNVSRAACVAALVGCGFPAAAFAAPNTLDVFDRAVAPLLERNEPKLILYAGQGCQGGIDEPAILMARRLKDIPYVVVIRVDLRGVPSFLVGLARKFMQHSQLEVNGKYDELAQAAGLKSIESTDRVHLVMEPDGAAHQLLGLAQGFQQAMAIVLDGTGQELLRAPFPAGAVSVEKALREAARMTRVSKKTL